MAATENLEKSLADLNAVVPQVVARVNAYKAAEAAGETALDPRIQAVADGVNALVTTLQQAAQ